MSCSSLISRLAAPSVPSLPPSHPSSLPLAFLLFLERERSPSDAIRAQRCVTCAGSCASVTYPIVWRSSTALIDSSWHSKNSRRNAYCQMGERHLTCHLFLAHLDSVQAPTDINQRIYRKRPIFEKIIIPFHVTT